MRRVLILSADELVESVTTVLRPYIGVAAEITDHQPIVELLLDQYCYGRPLGRLQSVPQAMENFKLPSDVTKGIEQRLSTLLFGAIQRGFGIVYPNRHYSHQWVNGNDLQIEEVVCQTTVPSFTDGEVIEDQDTGFTPVRMRGR